MRDESDRTKWIITALVVLVVILLGVVSYALFIKPAYQEYLFEKQQEAYNLGLTDAQTAILSGIQQSLSTMGYVQITLGEDQEIFLMPFDPNSLNQQAPAQ